MRIPFQIEVKQDSIMGIMHIPEKGMKRHAVIMCYGFNGYRSDVHRIAVKFGEFLEQKGIVLVRFDYRGQGISEGEMNDVSLERRSKDVCSVVDFVKGCFNDQGLPITLIGFSDGARIASLVAEKINVCSVIFWNPIFETNNSSYSQKEKGRNKNSMFRNEKNKKWSYQYYGLPVNINYLRELVEGNSFSSLLSANCFKYCIWGAEDRFTKDIRNNFIGIFSEEVLIPKAGHLFFGDKSEQLVFENSYAFVKKALKYAGKLKEEDS